MLGTEDLSDKLNISVALSDIKSQGGAKLFFDNLIRFLPEYKWNFTQDKIPNNTDVFYLFQWRF